MAFPSVAAVNASTTDTDSTSHVVSLPASISSGDLLICFLAGDGSGSWALDVPTGWNQAYSDENNSGGCNLSVRWKIADGTEGSTVTFTSTASEKASHRSFRITGHHATTPFEAAGGGIAGSQGSSANPDSPSLTPSWGAKDTLWISVYGVDDARSATAYPTDYADNQFTQVSGGSSGRCGLGLATRNVNATSQDPAAFTIDTSDVWLAATIGIQPAAAAAAEDPYPYIAGGYYPTEG